MSESLRPLCLGTAFALLSFLAASVLLFGTASADTWYVSALNGTDAAGCGSARNQSCLTVQGALGNAVAGDVIVLTADATHTVSNVVVTLDSLTFIGEGLANDHKASELKKT